MIPAETPKYHSETRTVGSIRQAANAVSHIRRTRDKVKKEEEGRVLTGNQYLKWRKKGRTDVGGLSGGGVSRFFSSKGRRRVESFQLICLSH